jgi:hypothetical protein
LSLAIALASRKTRTPSPATTATRKKKASPVYNNNNNGYSYSYSPTPRRRYYSPPKSLIWGPGRILSTTFAVAVAVIVARWASHVGRTEFGKWRNFAAGFFPKAFGHMYQTVKGGWDSYWKEFADTAREAGTDKLKITKEEIDKYYDGCCAGYLPKEELPNRFFFGSVKKTIKDIDDACKLPTDESIVKRWYQIMKDVKNQTVAPNILQVMRVTLSATDPSKLPVGNYGLHGGMQSTFETLKSKVRDMIREYKV